MARKKTKKAKKQCKAKPRRAAKAAAPTADAIARKIVRATQQPDFPFVTLYAVVAFFPVGALQFGYVRPVTAEDDCATGTWAVERVPVVGLLVCIGEPS